MRPKSKNKTMMKPNLIFIDNFYGRRAQVKVICLSLAVLSILFCSAVQISAQKRISKRRTFTKISRIKPEVKSTTNDAARKEKNGGVINNTAAITILNRTEADYLTGEASVSVNPKQPTVIRLGLAQNAVSVVEFPAIDQIYYIHEGNPKLVTIFQSPTKETDRSITLYPGEGFLPAASQKELSATVTMQMKSGLVIVLEIVPAPDIRQNAHRCVLNYNLVEVVAARQAAGLKVNLGDDVPPIQQKQTRANSRLMTANLSGDNDLKGGETNSNLSPTAFIEIAAGNAGNKTESQNSSKFKMKTGAQLTRLVNKKLAEAIKSPKEKFAAWSPAVKGLSLSTAKGVEVDDVQRLLIVAVKNETTEPLRLLEEMPELAIQTVDKTGNSLQLERLTRKYTETTALSGAIPAGATVYYAVVYENPILGANQKLLVSAAHDRAADAPVVASTNSLDKREDGKK
jgi:hypothetical protein